MYRKFIMCLMMLNMMYMNAHTNNNHWGASDAGYLIRYNNWHTRADVPGVDTTKVNSGQEHKGSRFLSQESYSAVMDALPPLDYTVWEVNALIKSHPEWHTQADIPAVDSMIGFRKFVRNVHDAVMARFSLPYFIVKQLHFTVDSTMKYLTIYNPKYTSPVIVYIDPDTFSSMYSQLKTFEHSLSYKGPSSKDALNQIKGELSKTSDFFQTLLQKGKSNSTGLWFNQGNIDNVVKLGNFVRGESDIVLAVDIDCIDSLYQHAKNLITDSSKMQNVTNAYNAIQATGEANFYGTFSYYFNYNISFCKLAETFIDAILGGLPA